jgi:hypothetical protein
MHSSVICRMQGECFDHEMKRAARFLPIRCGVIDHVVGYILFMRPRPGFTERSAQHSESAAHPGRPVIGRSGLSRQTWSELRKDSV